MIYIEYDDPEAHPEPADEAYEHAMFERRQGTDAAHAFARFGPKLCAALAAGEAAREELADERERRDADVARWDAERAGFEARIAELEELLADGRDSREAWEIT